MLPLPPQQRAVWIGAAIGALMALAAIFDSRFLFFLKLGHYRSTTGTCYKSAKMLRAKNISVGSGGENEAGPRLHKVKSPAYQHESA